MGFFETIFKVSLGVLFAALVLDSIGPLSGFLWGICFSSSFTEMPLLHKLLSPIGFLIIAFSFLGPPIFSVMPFFWIWNKIHYGKFTKFPEYSNKQEKEGIYFFLMYCYAFYAVFYKLSLIS
jgi:hypothetical protein